MSQRRRPRGRTPDKLAMIALGVVGLVVIALAAVATIVRPGDAPATVTPPRPSAVARTLPTPPPTTALPASPIASPVAPSTVACGERCLVRVADTAAERDRLGRFGVRPVYAHGGELWAAFPEAKLRDLLPAGPVAVLGDAADTFNLYMMRIPEGTDPAPVTTSGEMVDRIGNQFLMRVPQVPFHAGELTGAGIAVEKVPPYPATTPINRVTLPEIGDVGALASAVSVENLNGTIADLQSMGGEAGGSGSRYYASPGNVRAAEYLYRRFDGYGLRTWYDDFITDDGYHALNVVGEIPGRDPSKVYLVLSHFDSINDAGGSDAPGADDNATGVATTLELARILSGYQLAHPVRFLATNAEEVGIQGAPAFAAHAVEEGVPIAGAFNVDAVGSAANGQLLILNADENSIWLEDILVDMNDRFGLGQELRVRQNPAIVADDNSMRAYGFPTVLLAREMYGWSALHHTPGDVIGTLDLDNVRSTTQLVALALGSLVEE